MKAVASMRGPHYYSISKGDIWNNLFHIMGAGTVKLQKGQKSTMRVL